MLLKVWVTIKVIKNILLFFYLGIPYLNKFYKLSIRQANVRAQLSPNRLLHILMTAVVPGIGKTLTDMLRRLGMGEVAQTYKKNSFNK